jgi:hypothetical protein
MGRKICLFVYYVKFINTKLWMVEKGVALKEGLELGTVEGKIGSGIRKNESKFFFLHSQFQEIVGFSCLDW